MHVRIGNNFIRLWWWTIWENNPFGCFCIWAVPFESTTAEWFEFIFMVYFSASNDELDPVKAPICDSIDDPPQPNTPMPVGWPLFTRLETHHGTREHWSWNNWNIYCFYTFSTSRNIKIIGQYNKTTIFNKR